MRKVFTFMLLLPHLAVAQQIPVIKDADPSSNPPYAAVFLQRGLPDFKPLHNQIRVEPHTAVIPLADSSHFVAFVLGKNNDGETVYWVMLQRPDNTVSLTRASMRPDENGTLSGSVDLQFNRDAAAATPLRLRLLPAHDVLLYRWPGSLTGPAGGVPTVARSALAVGKAAPAFAVRSLDGELLRLHNLKGKIVVLNSWATYCAPCLEEMPGLNKLVEKYPPEEVFFLAIAWDTEADLRAFLAQRQFLYKQTLANEETTTIFGEAFPRNVVIDAKGEVVFDRLGGSADTYKELDSAIQSVIGAE